MIKKTTQHIQHYLPLIVIIVAGSFGFVYFSYDRVFQAAVTLAIAAAYFTWGMVHHHLHRDLHFSVVLEYLAIASIGVVVVFSLIFTA